MDKKEIMHQIDAVCKALNNITVTGIQNAGNLAGCYSVLQDVLAALQKEEDNKSHTIVKDK